MVFKIHLCIVFRQSIQLTVTLGDRVIEGKFFFIFKVQNNESNLIGRLYGLEYSPWNLFSKKTMKV